MMVLRNLLWVDCLAGGIAGTVELLFADRLARLYGFPLELIEWIGAANLLYASFSFSLAARTRRPKTLIHLLVAANGAWAVSCIALAVAFAGTATPWGMGHLLAEAGLVAGLAALEWSQRERLLTRRTGAGRSMRAECDRV